ncbi:MAG: TlpA family protein disulfide reductase [Saprospiraceae bacterium]|nr:TlpA family protein disulfide reductase [Saprospiraceae bacterium]
MKIFSKLSCTLALLIFFSAIAFGQTQLPSAEVKTLDGATINLQDFAQNGKLTIISLWATWCAPCKKELDAIAEIYEDWQADYNVELVAISIDTRRQLAKVKPMVETKGWPFQILSDANNTLTNVLNYQTIPQTYLIDENGQIVYSHNGYLPGDEYELEDQLKALTED